MTTFLFFLIMARGFARRFLLFYFGAKAPFRYAPFGVCALSGVISRLVYRGFSAKATAESE